MAKKIKNSMPGVTEQAFMSNVKARLVGTITGDRLIDEPTYADMVVPATDDYPAELHFAVRVSDGTHAGLARLHCWIEGEKTFEESGRYARALARDWHYAVYVFTGYEKTRRLCSPRAVYTFRQSYALRAQPGTHRWTLTAGSKISQPSRTEVLATQDSWDQDCSEIETACEAFYRIAALLPPNTIQGLLDGPKRAVAGFKQEAARLAAIGQQLDTLVELTPELVDMRTATADRLEAVRLGVLKAVQMASEIQLDVPDAMPDQHVIDGAADLVALNASIGEQADRQTATISLTDATLALPLATKGNA